MRLVLAALSFALLGRSVGLAQQYSHLSGIVRDMSDAVVPDAFLSVVSEDTGFRRSARTGLDGGYRVAALQPGHYKVTISKDGFRPVVHTGVKLDAAQPERVDFVLQVGATQEAITVQSGPPVLASEDASVGTLVGREWIERLPLNGRGVQGLLELAPGTVATPATRGEAGQFTANGQRPNSHYFTVDGVSVNTGVSAGGGPAGVTGGVLPGMTAFGSLHNLISMEALEEFRIQTSTAVPEYGRLPGAQITLSSRAGTNDFHGSGYEFFRNRIFEANDWFANRYGLPRAPSGVADYGGTLGGPIKRNRAFFFAGYEAIRITQPFVWRVPVPDAAIRLAAPSRFRSLLSVFPQANGPPLGNSTAEWTGNVNRPSRLDSGTVRGDLAVTQRISLFGRFNEAPSTSEFGNWQVNELHMESRSVTGGVNARIKPNIIADFRFNTNWASADSAWRPDAFSPLEDCEFATAVAAISRTNRGCGAFYVLSIAGLGQALSGHESDTQQRQWNLAGTTTVTRGRHQIRAGGDYRRLTPVRPRFTDYVTVMADNLNDLLAQTIWTSVTGAAESKALLRELSLFGQDTWRVTSRLTVNGGMRWEFNPPPIKSKPSFGQGPFPGGIAPNASSFTIWPLRYTNLAPRVGGAYRLRRDGNTVLRSGYGIYYDSSLGIATDVVHSRPNTIWQIGGPAADLSGSPRRIIEYDFAPDLRLPVIRQWNATVEHAFGGRDVLSVGYVGSRGRDLIRRELGGRGGPNFVGIAFSTNHGYSRYHGLQAQFRKRMSQRLQSLVSYSWSHSIDNGSTDSGMYWVGTGFDPQADRGSSDFDVRHSLNAAFTYEARGGKGWRAATGGWFVDGVVRARSGFPVNLLNSENAMGISFFNVFRPDVTGAPVWIEERNAPNGRRLNPAAFRALPNLQQGSLGRNSIAGFGMSQLDIALRRDFPVSDHAGFQFRVEAFNAFNQSNFGDPVRFLASPLFGQSVSMLNTMLGQGTPGSGLTPRFQQGGPRSLQMMLRFRF